MTGLLIKDFKLIKSQGRSMVAILILGIAMNLWMENYGFIISYMGFLGITLALGTISYDEYDNGNAFLFSLPVTPRDYVAEKYAFGLLFSGGAWLIGTAGAVIIELAKGSVPLEETLVTSLVVLPMVVLMLSLMLPLQLKFGAEKGRVIRIGVMMLIFALVLLGARFAEEWNLLNGSGMNALPAWNMGNLAAIGIGIVLVMLFLSWKISIGIMKKKEF